MLGIPGLCGSIASFNTSHLLNASTAVHRPQSQPSVLERCSARWATGATWRSPAACASSGLVWVCAQKLSKQKAGLTRSVALEARGVPSRRPSKVPGRAGARLETLLRVTRARTRRRVADVEEAFVRGPLRNEALVDNVGHGHAWAPGRESQRPCREELPGGTPGRAG